MPATSAILFSSGTGLCMWKYWLLLGIVSLWKLKCSFSTLFLSFVVAMMPGCSACYWGSVAEGSGPFHYEAGTLVEGAYLGLPSICGRVCSHACATCTFLAQVPLWYWQRSDCNAVGKHRCTREQSCQDLVLYLWPYQELNLWREDDKSGIWNICAISLNQGSF